MLVGLTETVALSHDMDSRKDIFLSKFNIIHLNNENKNNKTVPLTPG